MTEDSRVKVERGGGCRPARRYPGKGFLLDKTVDVEKSRFLSFLTKSTFSGNRISVKAFCN
jgi:hypothetical protein